MATRQTRKVIRIEMCIVDGIDTTNKGEDSVADLSIYQDLPLRHVHNSLSKIMKIDPAVLDSIQYFHMNNPEPLDLDQTLESLGVQSGDKMVVDTSRKRKKMKFFQLLAEEEDGDDDLTVVCYTRIFEAEGVPMKRIRVHTRRDQSCASLITDVCKLWNRENLKFRYGRHILTAERTFEDVDMVDLGEILVTGARG